MTNPYPNRVLTLAACLLGLAVVTLLIGIALANNGAGDNDVLTVSGWAFNATFMAILAWLVLKGITWRVDEARAPVEDTASRL